MTAPLDRARLRALAQSATRYEGYSVDTEGNVWSDMNWRGMGRRKLTPFPNSHGYPFVKVRCDGRMKKALVHVLVCEAFHGPKPSALHQVRHLNGVRADCRAVNLAWGTVAENAADRKAHGTERAAQNGKAGASKLLGRYRPVCIRGHDKEGRRSCEQCRRERRAMEKVNGLREAA